jgi:O-antigen/teichoic acid export membrane protein
MAIPASSATNKDLSSNSLRIGLAFTAPVIAALIVAPSAFLSIIGKEYAAAGSSLTILAFSVIPGIVVSNMISKLNNSGEFRKILLLGIIRIAAFVVPFFMLVPELGTTGASIAILIGIGASAAISLIWTRNFSKFVIFALASVASGILAGMIVDLILDSQILIVLAAVGTSSSIVLITKCTTVKELKSIVAMIRR